MYDGEEQDGKPTTKPSSWVAALSKFGAGMLCLTLHQVGMMYFSLEVRGRERCREGGRRVQQCGVFDNVLLFLPFSCTKSGEC